MAVDEPAIASSYPYLGVRQLTNWPRLVWGFFFADCGAVAKTFDGIVLSPNIGRPPPEFVYSSGLHK
jgi:hypothetical protein